MTSNLEILAHDHTDLGPLCLRRRELFSSPGTVVTGSTVDHQLLMSSRFTESEEASLPRRPVQLLPECACRAGFQALRRPGGRLRRIPLDARTSLLHPADLSSDSECGMELIFMSRSGPETKLVLPVDPETLEALRRTEGLSEADGTLDGPTTTRTEVRSPRRPPCDVFPSSVVPGTRDPVTGA